MLCCNQNNSGVADQALAEAPVDAQRVRLVQQLASQLSRSGCPTAIVAVTGWDSCWHAESEAFLSWLCGGSAPPDTFAVITSSCASVLTPRPVACAPPPPSSGGGLLNITCQKQLWEVMEQQQHHHHMQEHHHQQQLWPGTGANGGSTCAGAAAGADVDSAINNLSEDDARAALEADPKVRAFRQLLATAGVERIAVPMGWEVAAGQLRHVAGMELLGRWPLVQALQALDGAPLQERFEVRIQSVAVRSAAKRN